MGPRKCGPDARSVTEAGANLEVEPGEAIGQPQRYRSRPAEVEGPGWEPLEVRLEPSPRRREGIRPGKAGSALHHRLEQRLDVRVVFVITQRKHVPGAG